MVKEQLYLKKVCESTNVENVFVPCYESIEEGKKSNNEIFTIVLPVADILKKRSRVFVAIIGQNAKQCEGIFNNIQNMVCNDIKEKTTDNLTQWNHVNISEIEWVTDNIFNRTLAMEFYIDFTK